MIVWKNLLFIVILKICKYERSKGMPPIMILAYYFEAKTVTNGILSVLNQNFNQILFFEFRVKILLLSKT